MVMYLAAIYSHKLTFYISCLQKKKKKTVKQNQI